MPVGENSGVLGLSLELILLAGDNGLFEPVGLNAGAEGLSLVLVLSEGEENSGVLGPKEKLSFSLSLEVVTGVCCTSLLPWFLSIGEGWAMDEVAGLASVALSCSTASSN